MAVTLRCVHSFITSRIVHVEVVNCAVTGDTGQRAVLRTPKAIIVGKVSGVWGLLSGQFIVFVLTPLYLFRLLYQ